MRRFGKFLLIAMSLFMAIACTKRIYVPVESVRMSTDTVSIYKFRIDSILDRDTIRIEKRGDTVLQESIKWRYRIRMQNDTLYRVRTDSIYVREPYPVETVKEVNTLYTWQKLLIAIGIAALLVLLAKLYLRVNKFLGGA